LSGVVDQSLLWLVSNSWEEDKLGLVSVQSFHVELELFFASVGSSVIDSDTNSSCETSAQFDSLELLKSETTAVSNFASIPACLGRNDWSQLLDGSWEHSSCLCDSSLVSLLFESRLVVMSVRSSLPVLTEMYVWDDVVVLDHC